VVVVKSLASAISIGTGASVGREGPIVQIGSAIASTIGGWSRLVPWQRITLVAAGAGGGIAATFNTPLGAVLFSVELMMPEVSVRTFMPVAIATGTATFIGRLYFSDQPAFLLPVTLHGLEPSLLSLAAFTLLGVFTGVAAALYVHSIYWMEDRFQGLVKNEYLRHMLGMAMLGTLFYSLLLTLGHYHVEGVGYSTIQAIMDSKLTVGALLLLLFAAKLFATSITLGSGASGGVFSPALFLGATLGGAFGAFYSAWLPSEANAIPTFAMVGMASMLAGSTGAAMTAILMIFEMTRDYDIVLPMILAVAMAQGIRRTIMQDNIYTLKLARRGIHIPTTLHSHMFLVKRAGNVMNSELPVYPDDMSVAEFDRAISARPQAARHVVVSRGHRIMGVVSVGEAKRIAGKAGGAGLSLGDLSDRQFTIAREKDVMFDVIKRMSRRGDKLALVVAESHGIPRADDLLGYITNDDIAESVAESLAFRLGTRARGKGPAQ
jgi:CIC family chloride channel protein